MKTKHILIHLTMVLSLFTSCASTKYIFKKEVKERFVEPIEKPRLITENDLNKLPTPIANYLSYCGWLGKEVPQNFYMEFKGDFSLKEGKYMK